MGDPWRTFRDQVEQLVSPHLPEGATPEFERPPGDLADLALPCFPLAGVLKKAPAEIAEGIAGKVAAQLPSGLVERAEAVNGYVNFHADRASVAAQVLVSVHEEGPTFGMGPKRDGKLILEHTSANPNGPLHVGRARNPILGDTMARVLRHAGWDVEVQYYVDDLGKQVATLAWGKQHVPPADLPPAGPVDKPDHDLVRYYQAAIQRAKEDSGARDEIQDLVRRSEEGDQDVLEAFEAAYGPVLQGMLASLERMGITYDRFVKESQFVVDGSTDRVIQRLNGSDLSRTEDDGARWLDLKDHGIAGRSQRFVYQRRDGTSLYATRDVAYHQWKAKQARRLVNVLGEDHKLQAKQVRIALELLGETNVPEVVFYSFVALPDGKMSTRAGRVVYLDDLIEESVARAYQEVTKRRQDLDEAQRRHVAEAVGVGALRYNIARVQPEKPIKFRWEEALNFEGSSAPFLMYAHARCASILRKAGRRPDVPAEPVLDHPAEQSLLATLGRLAEVVDDAAAKDRPHMVASYAQEVAAALNGFYRDCQVLGIDNPAVEATRLAVVAAAKQVLAVTLQLLGVPALETM